MTDDDDTPSLLQNGDRRVTDVRVREYSRVKLRPRSGKYPVEPVRGPARLKQLNISAALNLIFVILRENNGNTISKGIILVILTLLTLKHDLSLSVSTTTNNNTTTSTLGIMSNYAKATLIALPRIAMGVLFLAAAIKFYPEHNDKWFSGNIDTPAWLFGAGSVCYTIATCMDGYPHFQTKNVTKIAIFFVYLFAGLCVTVGSCWFLQGVQDRHSAPELGHGFYVGAGVLMMWAVLWDILLIMMGGPKITLVNGIAILAIVPGASLFTVATMYAYPRYLVRYNELYRDFGGYVPSQSAFEFSASLYVAASMFFILHAFAYLLTVKEMLDKAAGAEPVAKNADNESDDDTKEVAGGEAVPSAEVGMEAVDLEEA
jgi:hypothetical protein